MVYNLLPLLCLMALFLIPGEGLTADRHNMDHYVQKYSDVIIPDQQDKKLAPYNHLIDYFCGFEYIRPRHKVNGDFIRALILAESAGNPNALSPKNAKGLTQIIYETGKRACRELADKPFSFKYVPRTKLLNLQPDDLYDPAVNIMIACYLIAKYNHQFQGKLDLVVAAWNAGEYSIVDNQAPQYQETLNLIGKVNGFFLFYINKNQPKQQASRSAYASRDNSGYGRYR